MIEPISQRMKDAFIKSMKNGEDMDIYTLRLGYNDGVRVTTKRFNEAVKKIFERIEDLWKVGQELEAEVKGNKLIIEKD